MECSICLLEINADQRTTACGHSFHSTCLNQWLIQSPSCPLCRSALPAPVADDDETDAEEDEGMVEDDFDIFFYAPAEMLPLFNFFQGIIISRITDYMSNPSRLGNVQRISPGLFQMMMEHVPQGDFDHLIDDHQGWERQEVINAFLEGVFDDEPPVRAYVYETEMDPSMQRMIALYEAYVEYSPNYSYANRVNSYQEFETLLASLSSQEQFLVFRSREYRSVMRSLVARRN